MFCSNCGKSISDESSYCMYCGQLVKEIVRAVQDTEDNSKRIAISIDDVYFWLQGPVERKSGGIFAKNDKVGRGFCFAFALYNSDGKPTTSDGHLIAVLNAADMTYGSDRKLMNHVSKGGGYRFQMIDLEVVEKDFTTDQSRRPENRNKFMYTYKQLSPLVYIEENLTIYVHLWFELPNGDLLYKRSDWLKWGNYQG